jgi:uncharacterized protein (TIGR03083 family)
MATNEELTGAYQAVRDRCIAIGRELSEDQAATMSPCCPEWSVKDLFAHLVGVPVDVLEGNVEGAATPEWADAQVNRRADDSLSQILDEWEACADQIDGLLAAMATDIDPRFFLDCWTHEWDVRQALGLEAAPDLTIPDYVLPKMEASLNEREPGGGRLVLHVESSATTTDVIVGDGDGVGEPIIEGTLSLFDFMRAVVGRRSAAQIAGYAPGLTTDRFVVFTASPSDMVDPVL